MKLLDRWEEILRLLLDVGEAGEMKKGTIREGALYDLKNDRTIREALEFARI